MLTLQQWEAVAAAVGGMDEGHEVGLLEAVAILVRLQAQLLHVHLRKIECQRGFKTVIAGVLDEGTQAEKKWLLTLWGLVSCCGAHSAPPNSTLTSSKMEFT